jgi:2,3-dihydroxybiphenyl 1,2-dioxygenase
MSPEDEGSIVRTASARRNAPRGNVKLGYLRFEVKDLPRWQRLLQSVIGMVPSDPGADGALVFTHDQHQHRVALSSGTSDDVTAVGWEAGDDATFESIVDHLKQAGIPLRNGSRSEARARSVERLVCFEDPDGNPLELFSGPRCSLRPFQSTLMPRGFLTGYTGMGHVLLTVRDLDRTRAFYCDVLGFVNHGYLDWQDVGLKGLFFYCNPRHHSIAVVQTPTGKRIHHFMLETNFMEDVGYVWERALANQVPIEMSLGQHIDERTFSFYGVTPSEFLFEVGYGTRLVDVANEPFHEYQSISLWGHHRAARGRGLLVICRSRIALAPVSEDRRHRGRVHDAKIPVTVVENGVGAPDAPILKIA